MNSRELEANQIAWRDRALVDFPFFCRSLKIRLKGDLVKDGDGGILAPFVWNEPQWVVWYWMSAQMRAGVPIRLIILKARQFGISTFFCAWLFWWMWRKMSLRCIIAAQKKGTTLSAMSETMDRFYQSLPQGFRPQLRAKGAERTSKDELYFEERKCGLLYIAADVKDSALGDAIDHALATEVAAYKNAEEFFGTFRPSMGRRRDTTLVMESTARPGWYWDKYKAGKAQGISVFLPWSVYKSLYSRPLKAGSQGNRKVWRDAQTNEIVTFTKADRAEMRFLSRQHAIINEQIGRDFLQPVDEQQMHWWRYELDNAYDGDEEWMNQEYPRDDITAFEKSVRGAFKMVLPQIRASVEEVFDTESNPVFLDAAMGTLHCDTLADTQRESHAIEFVEEDKLDFERFPGIAIFKWPVKNFIYTVGVDVADSMETSADEDDADFSVISVYCCNTKEQVAEWRGSIDPHELGDEVAKVGYLYNTALINVEYNNMGVTTIDRLTKYLEYPNRFRWPKMDEAGKLTRKEMWWTDEKSKQLLIGSWRYALKTGNYRVRSPGLQEEATAYQVKSGHYSAGPDSHADRIIAAALSWIAVEQTDYGMAQVLGGAEDARDPAHGVARKFIESRTSDGGLRVPRGLPADLAAELGDDVQSIEDTWGVPADLLAM